MKQKAIILLSGGMDSSTCLAIASSQGYECYALTIDYGQRHRIELKYAQKQAKHFTVQKHKIIKVDLKTFGGSSLTQSNLKVPKSKIENEIPNTYVPARNTIFLSLGLAWAEVIGAFDLFLGVSQVDYSGYPDCREQFIKCFERMANLATRTGINTGRFQVQTPLLHLSKAQIITKGISLGVDFRYTHSCYDPCNGGKACGKCPSCILRKKGFQKVKILDPGNSCS